MAYLGMILEGGGGEIENFQSQKSKIIFPPPPWKYSFSTKKWPFRKNLSTEGAAVPHLWQILPIFGIFLHIFVGDDRRVESYAKKYVRGLSQK